MNNRWLSVCLVCFGLLAAAVGCDEEGMIVLMEDGASEMQTQTPECEDGETQCEGDLVKQCENGKWGETKACELGMVCSHNKCEEIDIKKCSNDDKPVCEEGLIKRCINGEWAEPVPCEGENTCIDGVCTSREGCNVNESPRCEGNSVIRCVEGKWSIPEPCGGAQCVDGQCKCEGNIEDGDWICEDGIWVEKCDFEGMIECDDRKNFRICKSNRWIKDVCDGDLICGLNGCGEVSCYEGGDCPEGYICDMRRCIVKECEDGKIECVGNESRRECISGKWYEMQCGEGELCENGRCVTCHNGQTRCDPDNKSVFQLCENNEWKFVVNCGDKQCDGTRIGTNQYKACECEVGNTKPGNGNNDNCYFECNGGIKEYGGIGYKNYWVGLACNDGFTCVGGGCIKDGCSENTYKCDENSLMKCNGGMWSLVQSCGMGQTCNAKAHRCECTTGSYMCVSEDTGNRKYCRDGQWTDNNCTGNDICSTIDGGACIKKNLSCEKDKTICKSRTEIMGCSQGRWKVSDIKCNGTNEVCGQKGNDAKCVNMITGGGTWKCDDKFKEYVRCDQDNKSNTDGKEIRKCDHDRKWMKSDSCDGKTCGYRNKQIQCVEKNIEGCIEYSYTCGENGKKIKFCINNELRDFADCSSVGLTCIDDGKGQAHCGKNN